MCVCVSVSVQRGKTTKDRIKEAEEGEFCVRRSQDVCREQLWRVRQQCPSKLLFSFPRSHSG